MSQEISLDQNNYVQQKLMQIILIRLDAKYTTNSILKNDERKI